MPLQGTTPDAEGSPYRLMDGVFLHDLKPEVDDMAAEVRAGLSDRPKRLPPKFFYDERGSALFERITEQPEYYPTRCEMEILTSHQETIRDMLGEGAFLVEYGSGSSRKIRTLLEALQPLAYMPIDISRDHLAGAARALAADYGWLWIHATCADYTRALQLPWRPYDTPIAGFFPGSSIGNFEPPQARGFLEGVHRTLGPGGRVLVGVDREKDRATLERAYNDAAGVTAAFNRNVLDHVRRALGGDLDSARFDHLARYDDAKGCIEMHLVAREAHTARIGDVDVPFRAGERLHTESSYKYTPDAFMALADAAGFDTVETLFDSEGLFALYGLEAR